MYKYLSAFPVLGSGPTAFGRDSFTKRLTNTLAVKTGFIE